jgi:hypothetical protein
MTTPLHPTETLDRKTNTAAGGKPPAADIKAGEGT